jgi:hypothetical protein
MEYTVKLWRKLLRKMASDRELTKQEEDHVPYLLSMGIASPAALQRTLEIIAGERQIMLNERLDLTGAEEVFLEAQGIPRDDHGFCRPFVGHPRVFGFPELILLSTDIADFAHKLPELVRSPSDLVMLSILFRARQRSE